VLSLWTRWLLVSRVPAKNENLGWAKLVARIVQTRSTTEFLWETFSKAATSKNEDKEGQ